MKSTEDRVKDIVKWKLGVNREQIVSDASFENDLGADTFDMLELVIEIEKEFGIGIPEDDAENLCTVGKLIDYVKERCGP